jgi:hypothetical protein
MRRTPLALSSLTLASALASWPAQAAEGGLPPPEHFAFATVTVVNGGVDLDEAERFKQAAPQYPLRVVFSVRDGDYVVADEFTILRDGQVVAELPSAGPWLLIDLPPGKYMLQARFEDQITQRPVTVSRANSAAGTVHWVAPRSIV